VKHVLVIYEGAADAPSETLEGATPLQLARSMHASTLAARGACGLLRWSGRESLEQKLALLLGIAPEEARLLRRGPVEAVGTRVDPGRWTYAYRGNFITTDGAIINQSRVSGLSLDETRYLVEALMATQPEGVAAMEVTGAARVSVMFDHLSGKVDPGSFPGEGTDTNLDGGMPDSGRLELMKLSAELLPAQSINDVRVDLGENPASLLWLWGGGAPAAIGRPFLGAPLRAAMITNSPLARGLGRLCGMKTIELGDPWSGESKPDIIARPDLAGCFEAHDLTVIYVEAPMEAGRYGDPVEKVKQLDRLDVHVLARVVDAAATLPECRTMAVALPEENGGTDASPWLVSGRRIAADTAERWDEAACRDGALGAVPASRCLTQLIGD
jgi:2,3-bisphosphoglycerate-independent phosphoglycerate mutase